MLITALLPACTAVLLLIWFFRYGYPSQNYHAKRRTGNSGGGVASQQLVNSSQNRKRTKKDRRRQKTRCDKKIDEKCIARHFERVREVALSQKKKRERQRARALTDPPEIVELTRLLKQLSSGVPAGTCRWDSLVAIGDMYHRGSYPRYLPDPDEAMQCYKIAAMSPDGRVAGMAMTKYIEARTNPIPDEDKAGAPLPKRYAKQACNMAYGVFVSTPMDMFETPKCKKKEDQDRTPPIAMTGEHTNDMGDIGGIGGMEDVTMIRDLDLFMLADHDQQHPAATGPANNNINNPIPEFRHDAQNVHDHGIASVTDHNLKRLVQDFQSGLSGGEGDQMEQQNKSDREKIQEKQREVQKKNEEARRGILSCGELSAQQKESALSVLNSLSTNKHSTYGTSEREALASVWDKVQSSPDPQIRDNLTETLAKQLASGIEWGSTVCSSGKIARIVSTLDGVSNESAPRPMWAVREEIGSLAGKIRDETEERNISEDEQKGLFAQRVRDEYVNNLGMSSKIIEPIIEEYSYGF